MFRNLCSRLLHHTTVIEIMLIFYKYQKFTIIIKTFCTTFTPSSWRGFKKLVCFGTFVLKLYQTEIYVIQRSLNKSIQQVQEIKNISQNDICFLSLVFEIKHFLLNFACSGTLMTNFFDNIFL